MIRNSAVLLALLSLASPTAALAMPGPYFIALEHVKLIKCTGALGTGIVISENHVLTADHVVAGRECSIDGKPVEIIHENGDLDIAVVKTSGSAETRMMIDCGGYVKGESYLAIGFARGVDLVIQRVRSSGSKMKATSNFPNMPILKGSATYPGMSGGAVISEVTGEMVGMINAGDAQSRLLSRSLDQTYLCKAPIQ